jgi:hypothetical protein
MFYNRAMEPAARSDELREMLTETVSAAVREDDAYFAETERRKRLAIELEMTRTAFAEMMARLAEGTGCRLPYQEQEAFERIADPYLAANRMSEAYSRIVMLEMRVHEDAETKAKRQAEERAKREKAAEAEERRKAEPVAPPASASDAKQDLVRRAVGYAHYQAFPRLDFEEREDLLGEILDKFEEYAGYDGDPIDIVAGFCREFAGDEDAKLSAIPAFEPKIGEPADQDERLRRQCRAWAAACLERFLPKRTVDALAPSELAQGPPKVA